MTLSEMRQLLEDQGIQLTKSLGQNFLHDARQLERIAAAAELNESDRVLEIGPGLGPLTDRLLKQSGELLAIEKDARLVRVLEERFNVGQASSLSSDSPEPVGGANPEVEQGSRGAAEGKAGWKPVLRLLQADALALLKQHPRDWSDWKMVSNLPYSVASPILVELCQGAHSPRMIVATLQIEVAQRLMSGPDTRKYGVLTLLVQVDFEPVRWFKISAGCFFPQPDVNSACIVLKRRPTTLLPEEQRPVYMQIVKRAFSQRRKMMHKLLKQDWKPDVLDAAYDELGLAPQVRAEAVSLEQFVALTKRLAGGSCVVERRRRRSHVAELRQRSRCANQITMAEEIFDVVDEQDEVVGRATRAEVHARGLMHRAVHVLVFNSRGEVFLQKRSLTKDKSPGLWDSSASGHVDTGEDYDACAVRELGEELGLAPLEPLQRLFKLAACEASDQEHVWVYRCEAEGPLVLHPEEIERGEWVAPEEISRRIAEEAPEFSGAFMLIWRNLMRQG